MAELPAAAAAPASTATRPAAASEAAPAARARGRGRDRARDVVVHRLQAARQERRLERSVADVPAVGGAGVDALERFRPAVDDAENDRVGEQLGEDLSLLGELLPVFLRRAHVEPESERLPQQ